MVEIRFLADLPQHVDQLADWHHAQWHHYHADWSHEVARAELQSHALCRTLPTTLVLTENDMLLGSVSLLEDDAVELSAIGNAWLASLFVKPEARGLGFGAQLVNAVMLHAKNISLKEIFLFTPEHTAFYRQLGWQVLQQANVNGQKVDVMSYQIAGMAE